MSRRKNGTQPIDVHVGKRIRMRRIMLGKSQGWLGIAVGVTFQQIQKQERGVNRVSASALQKIATAMDVPVSFFFEGAPQTDPAGHITDAPSPAYINDFLATSDGLNLTKSFMLIPSAKLRRRIVEMVEEIAGGA